MRPTAIITAGVLMALVLTTPAVTAAADAPFTLASARVVLEGTSNIHAFTASTTEVRLAAVDVDGMAPGEAIDRALLPGALKAFDVVIPAATLKSPKEGIDKNMHKALKVQEHANIRFRLRALTPVEGSVYQAAGTLTIAGVDKEVTLALQVQKKGTTELAVTGAIDVVMTDFGIAPPKAMMGMLRTNPKVHITFDLILGAPLS
jgi:polyisoprenoid-binding protein YceI